MKLIFKYLKPYLFIVLTVVALTFVQVQTELTLPDYMSGIVTNGIQYGGVTEEMPHLITAKDMSLQSISGSRPVQRARSMTWKWSSGKMSG